MSTNNDIKQGKGGKLIFIVCIVVIIVLLGVVIYLLLNKADVNSSSNDDNGNNTDTPRRSVVVNDDNAEEIVEDLMNREMVPAGYYQVTMNSTWNFSDGSAVSDNAYVENAVSNTNSVYFDVVRSDTEETILASPILPVGAHMDAIKLDQELPAGTYDCVLIYYLLDEDENPVSTVNMGLTIVIQN